jgi:anaerobic ribonucleoside-triphosphate reductase activating protein
MKYVDTAITFSEVPDEVSLCISISGCPNRCPDCHSKYLWDDSGEILTECVIDKLIEKYVNGITCVCFMGGDADPWFVAGMAKHIKDCHHGMKTAWYSGKDEFPDCSLECFDYVKIGRFDKDYGPIDKSTTNQRMYKRIDGDLVDITEKFWRKNL